MNDNPLQLAKRETQQSFASKTVWIALLAAGVILGIAGPFQTEQFLPLIRRVLYWVALSCGFYFLGSFVGTYFHRLLSRAGAGELLAAIVAGAVAGGAIFAALIAINMVLFDISVDSVRQFWPLGLNVIGISTVITVAIVQIKRHMAAGTPEAAEPRPEAKPAPILRRLPMEKRGRLISLSVSDHYVEVTTANGQELVLMRLSDAMEEVGDTQGMQVHRSHWAALDQIVSARRDGAKAILTMADGREIPASRTYVPALKAAGVLPG